MKVREERWWLRGELETCVFCLHAYAHGTQAFCVACDRPVCGCCRTTTGPPERAPLCPECAAVADEEDDGDGG
jgi:hypothetical protein